MKAISRGVDLCGKALDACLTVIREADGIGLPQVTPDRMRAGTACWAQVMLSICLSELPVKLAVFVRPTW